MELGLLVGVVALGVVHGVLPDHGWPIAASYALGQPRKWVSGAVAALVIGVGHLLSSVALVGAYFLFSSFAAFAEGPWMKPLAGGLLILLGVYEYVSSRGGHSHGPGSDDHEQAHSHDGGHVETHDHGHAHDDGHGHLTEAHAEAGLRTLGVTAIVLGFAHEEPIQILAICAGTDRCLELMLLYSAAVIVAILAPTLLLVAGYQTHRERIERFTPYLPSLTAAVLVAVGLGFVVGVF
ncbi:MAG: ABC transporter permease [Natronomonas sp.]